MSWRALARKWHINLGLFATVTLGAIALSCFFIAHEPGQGVGKTLKQVHEGKFLPKDLRWIWIDGQGLLLLWLIGSGFLLHRRAKKTLNAESPDVPGTSALILFGSEGGNAEGVARALGERAEARGLRAFVAPLDGYDIELLRDERWLVVVTSTHGDGEVPANARKFWRALESTSMMQLPRLEYAVLALGDSSYEHFCAAGKAFDARLEALGAKRLLERVDCDVDFEPAAEAWSAAILDQLARNRRERRAHAAERPVEASCAEAPRIEAERPLVVSEAPRGAAGYSKKHPFPSRMLLNRRLTAEASPKETRHYVLDLQGSGLSYRAGDALGVWPTNCHDLVALTLGAIGASGEEPVKLRDGSEVSLRTALLHRADITKPSKELLAAVAARREGSPLAGFLQPGREAELRAYTQGREVIDFLLGGAPFTPQELVSLLRPLTPRLYSIASSAVVHPAEVHLTVATVRYEAHGLPRRGVCSTFLADRVRGIAPVPVFVQPAEHFRLPQDLGRDVIMVGPGTGIAPFRGFLQERESTGASGKNWLFFGAQSSQTDFLYADELLAYRERGSLHRLDTAFSRERAEKVYVQERMRERGAELWAWLQGGAHLYVCGDAARMAKDVHAELRRICCDHGGLGEDASLEYLASLESDGRYQRDVY